MASPERRLSVAYILTPFIAVAVAWPPIMEWPMRVNRWIWFSPWPFWLGVLCTPGYLFCWSDWWRRGPMHPVVRWWIAASLVGAMVASVGGAMLMLLTVLFWIFSAMSAGCCIHMLRRFRQLTAAANATRLRGS